MRPRKLEPAVHMVQNSFLQTLLTARTLRRHPVMFGMKSFERLHTTRQISLNYRHYALEVANSRAHSYRGWYSLTKTFVTKFTWRSKCLQSKRRLRRSSRKRNHTAVAACMQSIRIEKRGDQRPSLMQNTNRVPTRQSHPLLTFCNFPARAAAWMPVTI